MLETPEDYGPNAIIYQDHPIVVQANALWSETDMSLRAIEDAVDLSPFSLTVNLIRDVAGELASRVGWAA